MKSDQTSSLKVDLSPYKRSDSAINKAGIDGASCIVHAWNNWELDRAASSTKMGSLQKAAGSGSAKIYGWNGYDFFTRDTSWIRNHKLRNGQTGQSYIPNDQISAIIVQLAHDVQRWRCLDGAIKSGKKYKPCKAWSKSDGIAATFGMFEARMNEYFSKGCATGLKMPQCKD